MITVTRNDAKAIILANLRARRTVHLYGAPAAGKTSLAEEIANTLNLPFLSFRASQHMPEDFGGFPSPVEGKIKQLPLDILHAACVSPHFILLDEYTTAPMAVRAALLQIVDERRIGSTKLHPDTLVMMASNPEHQSVGGTSESLPERRRACRIEIVMDRAQWCAWLMSRAEKAGGTWGVIARDVALTIQMTPALFQAVPPEGIETSNDGWANAGAWHGAIDALTAHVDNGGSIDDDAGRGILCGWVYENATAMYLAIRKLRGSLPSVADVVNSPDTAGLPIDIASAVAALGLLAEVGNVDAAAAWVYASRLTEEIKVAATQLCTTFPLAGSKSKHAAKANTLRLSMMAKLNATANAK